MVRNRSIRTKALHVEPSMSPLKCPTHSRVRYVMVKYNTYQWLLKVTDDLWYGAIRMEVKDPVMIVLMIIQCLDNKAMHHHVSTLPLTHKLYTTPLEFILKMVYELTVHVLYKICCLFTNNNDPIRLKFCTCPCSLSVATYNFCIHCIIFVKVLFFNINIFQYLIYDIKFLKSVPVHYR